MFELGWASTNGGYPDWLQVDFSGSQTISEIDVITVQDSYGSPVEPTETMTFASYGVTAFEVQYWNGSAWLVDESSQLHAHCETDGDEGSDE